MRLEERHNPPAGQPRQFGGDESGGEMGFVRIVGFSRERVRSFALDQSMYSVEVA
jgi:hypothetical protein